MRHALSCLALAAAVCAASARAEEGMWTYDAFPSARVKQAHGFAPTQAWLDHARLSSVRLANGCSASFVSPKGLVMTNHHCIRSCVEDLSTEKADFISQGFYAKAPKDELRCSKVEANQLLEIKDVTAEVSKATAGLSGKGFAAAQKAEKAKLEKACQTAPDLRCDVVTLYHGGRHHLYRYRRFQDVRLVFVPEFQMAAFGGDPDNFNFPRYGFDVGFLRVYVNGSPAETPRHFAWSPEPAKEGDLVFVSGHPGGTERLSTLAELEFQRDVALPHTLLTLAELRGTLLEFQKRGPEHKRISRSTVRSIENGLKALRGRHLTLGDKAFMASKVAAERAFLDQVNADPKKKEAYGQAWGDISAALDRYRPFYVRHQVLESGLSGSSELFGLARQLVRAAEERGKPNAERLREYSDARLPVLEQQVLRQAPIYPELDRTRLAFGLSKLRELLGADDPVVKDALGKQSPEGMADALVKGTMLHDVKVREALFKGGKAAVDASTDPMILFARKLDTAARAVRARYEEDVEATLDKAGEQVAQAHFAVEGTSTYPDATFTLRLSYGQVKGWRQGDTQVAPFTTFGGAFERHTGAEPFALPQSWLEAQDRLDPKVPLNVATTNDIIGGNSGSPLIDRQGRIVGLIFDGNLPSLGGRYGYEPASNRAVGVHGQGILHGLERIYRAERVLNEIRPAQVSAPK